jgi:hypothetical protein
MRSVLAYSAARAALFAATAGVLFLVGARGLLLVALAVLLSGLVSYVLLSHQRDAMSSAITSAVRGGRRKLDQARTKEDPPPPP